MPPGPHVLYVLGTRTSLGRWVRTAYRGTPGHRPLRAGHGGWPLRSVRGRPLEPARPPPICAPADPVPCVVPLPVRPSPRWRATPRTSSSCSRRRRRPSNPYPNANPNPHPHPHPSRSWECSTARSSRPTTAPTPTRCCHATPLPCDLCRHAPPPSTPAAAAPLAVLTPASRPTKVLLRRSQRLASWVDAIKEGSAAATKKHEAARQVSLASP